MKTLARVALSIAAAALLVGCGGSQPPIGVPGAVPQSDASTRYKSLYSFGAGYDGQQPKAALIDVNGTLYGTTYGGGTYGNGTIFSMSTNGIESVLHNFKAGRDGGNPSASLIEAQGLLYGTTENYGGGYAEGTVFSISTNSLLKTLHAFKGHYFNDGAKPVARLIDVMGKLYGTTSSGGAVSTAQFLKSARAAEKKCCIVSVSTILMAASQPQIWRK